MHRLERYLKNRKGVRGSFAPCLAALFALGCDAPARTLASPDNSRDASAAIASTPSRDRSEDRFSLHWQATYVEQAVFGFHAPYSGPNSLTPGKDRETTDVTVYLGARLWSGGEVWANPEIDQGFGLDNTLGVAGFPSGEAYKVGKSEPYLRLPRLFVRHTLNLGGASDPVEAAANRFRVERSADRLVFTLGKFGVTDIFDMNSYAHDPRGDFLNWAALDAGTFDYAADAWGYTVGAAVEWYEDVWAVRLGLFDLSDVPNSEHLKPGFHEFQSDFEVERRHQLLDKAGKVLLTIFNSRGRMGLLDDAAALAGNTGQPADIAAVRRYRSRFGASLGLEQELASDLGLFARLGKAAGNVEAYELTDIDRTVSVGLSLKGARWGRPDDTFGLAGIDNRISGARERFLNARGLGILVGDGQLPHPGPEQIVETYYELAVGRHLQLTLDYQWISHPAYNEDRGPVSIAAARVHVQF